MRDGPGLAILALTTSSQLINNLLCNGKADTATAFFNSLLTISGNSV